MVYCFNFFSGNKVVSRSYISGIILLLSIEKGEPTLIVPIKTEIIKNAQAQLMRRTDQFIIFGTQKSDG